MKIQLLLLATLLSTVGRGFASDIIINLDGPLQIVAPGNNVTFTGTIVNNDPVVVDLNFIEVDLNGFVFTVDESVFFGGPATVDASTTLPLTQTIDFALFDVAVDAGAPGSFSSGTVSILGGAEGLAGYDPTTQDVLGTATFQVSVVPEPSTFVITFAAVAGLYLLRRRKINFKMRRVQA